MRNAMMAVIMVAAVWTAGDGRAVAEDERTYPGGGTVAAEGTSAWSVRAETVRLEFVVGSRANSAEAAIAGLKQARDRFSAAVASSLGTTPEIQFGHVRATRPARGGEASGFCYATQTAVFRLGDLPKDDGNVDLYLQKLTAAVYDSGAAASDVEGPVLVYEAVLSGEVRDKLLSDAAADAKRRARAFAKALGKGEEEAGGGYWPKAVSVNGRRCEPGVGDVVEGDTLWMQVSCSVNVTLGG